MTTTYTFGDNQRAQTRLELLARLYAPSSTEFIQAARAQLGRMPEHACDLGCGPGYTTRLLHETSGAKHTTGLEQSDAFLGTVLATRDVQFVRHDVTKAPFPCPPADLLYARFLVTHLADRGAVLRTWASQLTRGGVLALEELDHMEGSVQPLQRYYAMLTSLQDSHAQQMNVGAALPSLAREAGLDVRIDRVTHLVLPGDQMAILHHLNFQTWRHDPFVSGRYPAAELDALEGDLKSLTLKSDPGVYVDYYLRQLIATHR